VRRLRNAIDRRQFRLVYQPKADMRTGSIVGVEALARWEHPRGTITPSEFVPIAERREAEIKALTDWTLVAAFDQARRWQDDGHELTMAVNLSPRSALDPGLPDRIGMLFDRFEVSPAHIQLELTETAVFSSREPGRVSEALDQLAEMGIVIALDDFGTGYSSLSRLRDLPIHKVKIDQSFVSHMDTRPQDALIVRSVIALAKGLHLTVVAEGVETEPVWRRLSDLGCDMAQGHYLTSPLPPDDLIGWVRQWEELYAEAHRMADELLERRLGASDRRSGQHDRRHDGDGEFRFAPQRRTRS
jgi:EAL domain-containing protein (putative c-di-GMP-specific phosphodiesterase class I)